MILLNWHIFLHAKGKHIDPVEQQELTTQIDVFDEHWFVGFWHVSTIEHRAAGA